MKIKKCCQKIVLLEKNVIQQASAYVQACVPLQVHWGTILALMHTPKAKSALGPKGFYSNK